MPVNLRLPSAEKEYSQDNENQMRGALRMIFSQITSPTAQARYALTGPDTVLNGCVYFTVTESTRSLNFFYQDSTGTLHGPIVLGTY